MNELPEIARAGLGGSKAQADQIDVQPYESGLLTLARVRYPTVKWWHGYRKSETSYGSFCYVCEEFTVKWSGNAGPPMTARQAIHDHKLSHRAGMPPAASTATTKGKRK